MASSCRNWYIVSVGRRLCRCSVRSKCTQFWKKNVSVKLSSICGQRSCKVHAVQIARNNSLFLSINAIIWFSQKESWSYWVGGKSAFKMIKMRLTWHINFFLSFQVLLDLASLIFEEQQSLEVILKKIAATIISFMQVQKCTIFIVDEDCSVSTNPDCILNWLIVNCVNGKVYICTITDTGSASASWIGQQLLMPC